MPALFIAGTGTDVGKTYVAAALLRALRSRGELVDAVKPLVSGFDETSPGGSDPAVLLAAMDLPVTAETVDRMSPWRFHAALAPEQAARLEGRRVAADQVIALCRARIFEAADQLLLIEGAGGIMSPLDETTTMLDLVESLAIPTLLVAGSYLGTISHTLTAARILRGSGVALTAVVVSQSPAAPPFAETTASIRRYLPTTPIRSIARDQGFPEDLLGEIRPRARSDARSQGVLTVAPFAAGRPQRPATEA